MREQRQWFAHRVLNTDAEVNFFAFPYAGGSPSMFAPWKTEISKKVNFYPVLYPNREMRKNEPMPDTVDELVNNFVNDNLSLFNSNFILFGHCTGGLIAYKVLLEIRRRSGKEPLCLIASGTESPRFMMNNGTKEQMEDEELIRLMVRNQLIDDSMASNPIFAQYYLPIYKSDLDMLSSYQYADNEPLECPVYAVAGEDDMVLQKEKWADWKSFSKRDVAFRTFPGKHFYLTENKNPLLQFLNEMIKERRVLLTDMKV